MAEVNRIRVTVCGTEYALMSGDAPEYVAALAAELDERLHALNDIQSNVSQMTALMLCSINMLDELNKLKRNDGLRAERDALVTVSENLRKKVETAQTENADLTTRLTGAQEQLDRIPELENRLNAALSELSEEREQSGWRQTELTACKAELESMKSELAAKAPTPAETLAVSQPAPLDPTALRRIAETALERVRTLETENARLKAENAENKKARPEAEDEPGIEIDDEPEVGLEELSEVEGRILELEAELTRLRQENEGLQAQAAELSGREAALSVREQYVEERKQALDISEAKAKLLGDPEQSERIEALTADNAGLRESAAKLRRQIEEYGEQLRLARDENEELQKWVEEAEEKADTAGLRAQRAEDTIRSQTEEIARLYNELERQAGENE